MPIFLLLLILLSSTAHAAMPYTNNLTGPAVFYATDKEACEQMIPDAKAAFDSSNTRGQTITYTYSYNGSPACMFNFMRSDGFRGQSAATLSTGKSAQALYGQECKPDDEATYTWPLGRLDSSAEFNIAPGTQISPPANACIDGCKARHSGVSSCFNTSQEQGSITYCDYNAKLTGETCSTSENQPPEVPQPTAPTDPTDPTDPADPGDGGSTPGDGGTDPGNGGTPPGDGGTNPGNGGTPPGDGSTNPGGGGTTPGNGGTNPGGGDSNGGSASGLACESPLACSGDAVQCALLTVQKQVRCDAAAARDFPAQKDAISNFLDAQGDGAELDEGDGEIDVSGLFSGPTDARFLPAACPPPRSFSLTTMGGKTFEFTYAPLCQLATDLGYLIVLAASLFFAIYVGRAAGGE